MIRKRFFTLSALALAASLAFGERANASYSYTTTFDDISVTGGTGSPTITTIAPGGTFNGITFPDGGVAIVDGGTTVELLDEGRTGFNVPSDNTINVGSVLVQTTTASPSSDTFAINYRDSITLINNPPPGQAATSPPLPFTGTLTFSGINTGNGTVSNVFTSPTSGTVPVGGVIFTGGITNFSFPTVNGPGGNLGGTVDASVVPEPASMAMLGTGLAAVVGLGLRRRQASSRA